MVFNSVIFVLFFIVVVVLHYMPFSWRIKKINLLIASYFFYAAWNPPFVILLWISTCVDWFAAGQMQKQESRGRRKLLLWLSLLVNLGMLSWFKYGTLFMQTYADIVAQFGFTWTVPDFDIILPVGISFYTFQTLSYTIDVYLKRSEPESSFLDFALFVTFFPQLVAGPIVRPKQLLPQFKSPKRATSQEFSWGAFLFTWGVFQKSVLADSVCARVSGHAFGFQEEMFAMDAWLSVFAFSAQIFFDFAGYSLCAIGVALCLGFSIPNNFKSPYAALGFSDFWRRWHISLSEWLRDYLYIPLGGNKKGGRRTLINLMLTMLLGGLWHGASWRFVVWGGVHGTYLIVERLLRNVVSPNVNWQNLLPRLVGTTLTFIAVSLTWVFFAAPPWESCEIVFRSLVGHTTDPLSVMRSVELVLVLIIVFAMLTGHWLMRDRQIEEVAQSMPNWLFCAVWVVLLVLIILTGESDNAFIYFQF